MRAEGKTQISLRIPSGVLMDFERIAKALDRDRTWVMLRAFQAYLDGEGGQTLAELQGIEQLDGGQTVDFDKVLSKAETIIADARAARRSGVR